ncbi:sporulation protein YhbH [Alicyclobacillus mali]|uniref:Sporulation protein YhbH n=1 Tax=Alicyclobacillus mali (ex Roth et al. 2021) TaxID=1123961 RepID=A0ABS0EZE1_9BACL|nr:sporulation protein YhbH [Alicyclobacillus mali (ex Roth et al. 2021)]MBF8376402.1 sporulation protein YhbH [Alicyclobacillus mali (ex Roth et al. 2021)]
MVDFTLQREDWSLHRKGHIDQERHREKVREAIREHLADLVSDESLIMSDGKQIIKIPIRSLEEYRIRYSFQKGKHVGTGSGETAVGDLVARGKPDADGQPGPGQGEGAGSEPGVDYAEAEVTLEDIQQELFRELELPDLAEKDEADMVVDTGEFRDVRKKGITANIDKKRTLLQALRHAKKDDRVVITPDDLRYKTWETIVKPDSNAVILAMMDLSGSMGLFEKYCARTFFFWMTRFLRTKYANVQIRYIAHHTEAHEVDEEYFFTKGESGGTICSSAYRYALDMVSREYPPERYNIYPIHFSDGDNLTSDNDKCVQLVKELSNVSRMFGYAEVNQYSRSSTLMGAYGKLQIPRFRTYVIRDKSEIYGALRHFFSQQQGVKSA